VSSDANRLPPEWLWDLLQLKRTPRAGWFRVGVERPESVADHSFAMALLVRRIARGLPDVDAHRAISMALLHDFAEAQLTDIPNPAKWKLPEGAFAEAERGVVQAQWPDDPEARDLLEDFEQGVSPEARLVRACDHLEFLIQAVAYHRSGRPLTAEMLGRGRNGASFDHPATAPLADAVLSELGF
jgi:putative hydrolase of HD superfamily